MIKSSQPQVRLSELCRRLVSSINFSQQAFKSFPKHVRESSDAVVWEADSADSLKDAKLFLSSFPNIRLHDPVLLNATITVLDLQTWDSNEEPETSFNLLFPSADPNAFRAFSTDPMHEILLLVTGLSMFQALFSPC